jgi:hypothetical protein
MQSSFLRALDGNGWKPDDTSNDQVDAEQFNRIKVESLPSALVVELNRNAAEVNENNVVYRKVLKEFKFPLVSTLNLFAINT